LKIAIVGTRSVSAYGKRMTAKITESLVQKNIPIISGFARGVDTISHSVCVKKFTYDCGIWNRVGCMLSP